MTGLVSSGIRVEPISHNRLDAAEPTADGSSALLRLRDLPDRPLAGRFFAENAAKLAENSVAEGTADQLAYSLLLDPSFQKIGF